jgi:hypothetical protein
MYAYIKSSIKAMLSDNTAASNYHENCFADDVTYGIALINDNLAGWDNRDNKKPRERISFIPRTGVIVINSNSAKDGSGTFMIKQENFKRGEAENIILFNFGRSTAKGENPFKINSSLDFSVTDIHDTDTSNAETAIEESGVTFFYGRAFSENYEGKSPIAAHMRYEVFCFNCVRGDFNISLSDMSPESSRWFLNPQHNGKDGDILYYAPRGSSLVMDKTASLNGKSSMNIKNNSGSTPYQDTIHAVPNSWLINNPENEHATDISFTVNFIGEPAEWAGKGMVNKNRAVGATIDAMPSNRTYNKMSW